MVNQKIDMKKAIVYLAQNSSCDTAHRRNSREMLERSLDLLYENYNRTFRTPVLIFHEGDFLAEDQEAISRGKPEIEFHRVHFELPDFFMEGEVPENWTPGELSISEPWSGPDTPMGVRHMCRFYSLQIFDILQELGCDWYMRMDDDSFIHSPIEYDLFDYLAERGYKYGYRADHKEALIAAYGFGETLLAYVKSENIRPTFLMEHFHRISDPVPDSLIGCAYDLWGYYNNFHVTQVGFWMQPKVQRFLRHMDRIGAGYKYRWSDLLIQSAAVQIFMPKKEVYKFQDWTYEHATRSGDELRWGGVFQGTLDKDHSLAEDYKERFGRTSKFTF